MDKSNNLNFYHFLQFTVGRPEMITMWLFSKLIIIITKMVAKVGHVIRLSRSISRMNYYFVTLCALVKSFKDRLVIN